MNTTSFRTSSLGVELYVAAAGSADDLDSLVSHEFWPQFVPEAEVAIGEPRHKSDLSISIAPEADWKFNSESNELVCSPGNIVHAICTAGYMLEAERQRAGMYTVHGNSISKGDKTVALLGPISGIGKTGLSSYAANAGWQWVSDEKFVMDEQGEYMGSVRGILQDKKTEQSADGNMPTAAAHNSRDIAAFVIPIVTDDGRLTAHKYDTEKAFWHLHDELSRDIRMTPFDIDGPDTPLPSFDSVAIATKRRAAAINLSRTIPFHSVMGKMDAILDYLSD